MVKENAYNEWQEIVVIVGAGPAGISAAITSASRGAQVILVEKTHKLGGTIAQSLIHTIGGLYDSRGECLNKGLTFELSNRLLGSCHGAFKRRLSGLWNITVSPDDYERVVEEWIAEYSGILVLRDAHIKRINVSEQLVSLVEVRHKGRAINIKPISVVDATGEASVTRLINPNLVTNVGPRAMGGLIFRMRGVKPDTLCLPRNIEILRSIKQAARKQLLPWECAFVALDRGVYEDEVYIKLSFPIPQNWENPRTKILVRRRVINIRNELVAFLLRRSEFLHSKVVQTGLVGIRDGCRIRGEYCLGATDVRGKRRFPDAVCRCAWPIEYWDAEKGIMVEYQQDNDYYEIPARSLKVQNMQNLWAAGKCLSADHLAQSSARVAGVCWAMGEAVGRIVTE